MVDSIASTITIENFGAKLSTFTDSSTLNHLYGLVDMGSNGIRFSISDLSPPNSRLLKCIYRERASISLYDALHDDSTPGTRAFYFSKHTIAQVAETLQRFKAICDGYGVRREHINVFATEAMRTAKNQEEMLSAVDEASGLTIDLLSPDMESLFGAMGARSGFPDVDGLFMDLGGGSVQMTYVNSRTGDGYDVQAAEAATSMPFGAAKLTAALRAQDTADAAKQELRGSMKSTFDALAQKFPHLKEQAESTEGIKIYFCGGGFRGYGSMLMHTDPIQPYPIPIIGGYTVPGHTFIKWREMLHANNYEDAKVFGMSKRRRQQFPAIVSVVQALVEAVPKIREVTFCAGGNREGVLFMKLPTQVRESHPIPLFPSFGTKSDPIVTNAVAKLITSALPSAYPVIFSNEILHYFCKCIWVDQGHDGNAARMLHDVVSGTLADLPGLTHQVRAILALTLSSRWGSDLGPVDLKVCTNLQSLIGNELSWWCQYIGTLMRFLGMLIPACPVTTASLNGLHFEASESHGLGKKGHKVGMRLLISLSKEMRRGVSIGDLEGMFRKVGKGIPLAWRVEAEVVES